MENIPHGITIESYTVDISAQARGAGGEGGVYSLHTYRDLCLIPVCRPVVQPPLEKTLTLDVEGMSGVADLSHGLTGYPVFKDREGTWQFWLDTDSYQEKINYYGPVGDRAYRELRDKLVSLMRSPYQTRIILDDEPDFYYIGRVWLDAKPTYQYDHAKFTLRYRLYPYKYLRSEYGKDWLWDTFRFTTDFADARSTASGMWHWDSFCFETDLATPRMKDVAIPAGQTKLFPLVFTDKPSAVFVTSTAKAAAKLVDQNGGEYTRIEQVITNEAGVDYDMPKQNKLRYQFRTKNYPLQLVTLRFSMDFTGWTENVDFTVTVYRNGNDVALASAKCTIYGRFTYSLGVETGSTISKTAISNFTVDAGLNVRLEPNTTYLFQVTAGKAYSPTFVRSMDAADFVHPNDYITQLPSEDTVTYNDTTCYPVLFATMTFYPGNGALLEPNTRTNIGTVGRNVDDSGMTVSVTAQEDTVVSIEYNPAYL